MPFSDVARHRVGPKAAIILLFSAILLLLTSCDVTSINALYDGDSDPDLRFEMGLTGSWSHVEEKCTTVVTITAKDKGYDFRSVDHGAGCGNSEKVLHQQGHLVKLDSYYFLDLAPTDDQVCESCLATHWIARAEFDDEHLRLTAIDSDALAVLIQAGVVHLSTMPTDANSAIPEVAMLTSRPQELKDFCRGFATDPSIFKPESTSILERAQSTEASNRSMR